MFDFDAFKKEQPDEIKLREAGIHGEDIVLKKEITEGGGIFYAAEVRIPFVDDLLASKNA